MMEMFQLPSNSTAKEGALWDFKAVLLLLYCLLHLMQRLLSCSAWLFLLADAEQAAKLFQYQAITEYKSCVCSFIYNMQPHQLPHAQSDNLGTAQAGQDRTACSSQRQKPTPLQTFPSVPFWQCLHLPPFHLYPPLHSLSFPSTPSSTPQGKGAWAVAGWATAPPPPRRSVLHPGRRVALSVVSQIPIDPKLLETGAASLGLVWGMWRGHREGHWPPGSTMAPRQHHGTQPAVVWGSSQAATGSTNHPSY